MTDTTPQGQAPADTNTASGAADDSLLLCASDLQHSAIYDNHVEMQACIRAVANRIAALASAAAPAPQPNTAYAALPDTYYLAGGEVKTWDENHMRAFADATCALRIQQPSTTPQADSQPAPANTRQIVECYGDCPEDPKTCRNQCKFEGRAARAPADSVTAPAGWVSVDERLPEPDEPVLAHNGKWTGVAAWMSGEYLEPLERWQDEHREFIEMMGPAITHWMPLPAPPIPASEAKGASHE